VESLNNIYIIVWIINVITITNIEIIMIVMMIKTIVIAITLWLLT